ASVVSHELAHSLVGRANGIPIESITLFIFGGVARMTREATRPGAEFKMAVAGPISSLVLGGLFGIIWWLVSGTEPAATMVLWLAVMNVALAVFNLIPGFPLDGGRVFRSLLWRYSGSYSRATRIATRVGQGIGYLFILGGILLVAWPSFAWHRFADGLWIVFIGWFLQSAASASYRQLRVQEALQTINTSDPAITGYGAPPPDVSHN
ncbi:MAG: site-2 protease family protein, partial [Chloroflexi bacterium]|nr:site-2 protease family protein [Chloroflexota bacterium]